ncbi:hypothetical protein BVI1335_350031 [Burkholderia vietnamiensis]|nr:hypothetical protein BVI1335_350031 [Burkholderia vietnamiensis]
MQKFPSPPFVGPCLVTFISGWIEWRWWKRIVLLSRHGYLQARLREVVIIAPRAHACSPYVKEWLISYGSFKRGGNSTKLWVMLSHRCNRHSN